MSRPLAIAFLVLLFIAGIAAGVFIDRIFLLEPRGPRGPGPHGPQGGPPPAMFLRVLTDELSLSDEQAARIASILEDAQRDAHATLEGARPALDAVRTKTSEQIQAVLTPEQRARFQHLEQTRPPMPLGPPPPFGGPPPGRP